MDNLDITVYSKEGCERCKALISFLKKNSLQYTEKDIDKDEVVEELLDSNYVIENFCDEEQCIVTTPIIKLDEVWMHNEFFDTDGFNEERAKEILKLQNK